MLFSSHAPRSLWWVNPGAGWEAGGTLSPFSAGAVRASSVFPILSVTLLFFGGLCVAASEFHRSRHNVILSAGIFFVSAGEQLSPALRSSDTKPRTMRQSNAIQASLQIKSKEIFKLC